MNKEELKERTYSFARRCIKLSESLPTSRLGKHIHGQLVRSSTSVAANYRAALVAQSKASFITKLSIVIEEADESWFWLQLIIDEELIKKELVLPLYNEAHEITSLFIKARKTAASK